MLLILFLLQVIVYFCHIFVKAYSALIDRVMSVSRTEGDHSDDEIFFGKMTFKEVKKRLFLDDKLCASSLDNSPRDCMDPNDSLKILETHSAPNLLSHKDSNCQNSSKTSIPGWDIPEDDSFIKIEKMVTELCIAPDLPHCTTTVELNNTTEVIEYILNSPGSASKMEHINFEMETGSETPITKVPEKSPKNSIQETKYVLKDSLDVCETTPGKKMNPHSKKVAGFMTPAGKTPNPVFKTPGQPLSIKSTASSCKKTPNCKSKAYEHVMSPVAFYIRNSPSTALVQSAPTNLKKPLPGPSSIPKLSQAPTKQSNKENVNLPSLAYKSAKTAKVIELSEQQKPPKSQWAKKTVTSLPRPVVTKHVNRLLNSVKKRDPQQDSFTDLSYDQAEVSVCTEKTSYGKNF